MENGTRERPILFSGEMVRAIRDGRKRQTRRVVKPQPKGFWDDPSATIKYGLNAIVERTPTPDNAATARDQWINPYARIGDVLWVREAFSPCVCAACEHAWPAQGPHGVSYRATHAGPSGLVWRPSIFMPRWASRLLLEVESVRVQRLQEISYEDAIAEGFGMPDMRFEPIGEGETWEQTARRLRWPQRAFSQLWDSINAARGYPWAADPWVWAITFRPSR